jgi:hypothetical protein
MSTDLDYAVNMSPVQMWAESAVELEKYFLKAVLEAVRQFEAGNRTDLSILITVTHGIKTDLVPVIEKHRMEYATPLKRILTALLPHVTFKQDKKKSSGVSYHIDPDRADDSFCPPQIAREALTVITADGATRKSKEFKDWLAMVTPPKVVAEKSLKETGEKAEKDVVRLAKSAKDNGFNQLAYLEYMAAEINKELAKQRAILGM